MATLAGKHEAPASGQWMKLAQYFRSLTAQRHKVRFFHLHPAGGNVPLGAIKINLGPFGFSEFARTDKQ